jgi:hypothetical protein
MGRGNEKIWPVDSNQTRKCIFCKENKALREFYSKTKTILGIEYFYQLSSFCKKCEIDRIVNRIKKIRRDLLQYGGNKCKKCGYSKCPQALEFHHRNAQIKDFSMGSIRSITKEVIREINKCDLLCSNCHREEHFPNLDSR